MYRSARDSALEREQRLPTTMGDTQQHVPSPTISQHLHRGDPADGAREMTLPIDLTHHDLHATVARIVGGAGEGEPLLLDLRADLGIDHLEGCGAADVAARELLEPLRPFVRREAVRRGRNFIQEARTFLRRRNEDRALRAAHQLLRDAAEPKPGEEAVPV